MFDYNAAIKSALSDFDRFKAEMEATDDPKTLSPELIRSVQTITKQACQALGIAHTFGASFILPKEIRAHVGEILDYFLSDPEGVRKLALLAEATHWDYQKNFSKLNDILKQL